MSYNIEIVDLTTNKIEISTSINDATPVVEILEDQVEDIIISHDIALLPSDFYDNTKIIINDFLQAGYGVSIVPSGSFLLISTSGLQPSGNYSAAGHNHSSSDITNFNSSVSGLLPVKNILSGNGISVTSAGADFTVAVTGQFGLTSEQVDDRVSNLLVAGNYVNLNYNDSSDILTISVTGIQPSGNYSIVGHTHTSSDITNFNASVSGLLPTVANSGANRILTSTGSNLGVSAQTNLTFNGSLLSITGSGVFTSGLSLSNQTASTIASFDSSKNIVSLPTGIYPSLNELSGETIPSSVQNLTTKSGPYSYNEMLEILSGPEWTVSFET